MAKACTREDFGDHEAGDELFTSWTGFSMICPDLSNLEDETWKFTGDPS